MFSFLTFALALLMSCSDPCKDVDCGDGVCDDGICNCNVGFEGTNCDTETRAKFYGIYNGDLMPCLPDVGVDLTQAGAFTALSIVAGPGPSINEVVLTAPSGLVEIMVTADINTPTFPIPETSTPLEIPQVGEITVTASGLGTIIDENTIELDLLVGFDLAAFPIPIPPSSCKVIMTKQ